MLRLPQHGAVRFGTIRSNSQTPRDKGSNIRIMLRINLDNPIRILELCASVAPFDGPDQQEPPEVCAPMCEGSPRSVKAVLHQSNTGAEGHLPRHIYSSRLIVSFSQTWQPQQLASPPARALRGRRSSPAAPMRIRCSSACPLPLAAAASPEQGFRQSR